EVVLLSACLPCTEAVARATVRASTIFFNIGVSPDQREGAKIRERSNAARKRGPACQAVHVPVRQGIYGIKQQHQKRAPSRTQSRAVRHPVTQPSGPMLTIWSPAGFQYSHSSSPGCARRTRVGSPQLRFTSAAFIPTRMVFWIMAWRNSLLV